MPGCRFSSLAISTPTGLQLLIYLPSAEDAFLCKLRSEPLEGEFRDQEI